MKGKPWGRAREMGGANFIVYEWFPTLEACQFACEGRKTKVKFFPLYLPMYDVAKTSS